MLLGHVAVGLVAKRAAPELSLSLLVGAAFLLDLVWPIFLLLGVESVRLEPGATAVVPLDLHDYPYSHSLAGALGWSLLAALAVVAAKRGRWNAWVVFTCAFSHWVLDYVTHAPDMPLWPGSAARVGLGLWYSIPATLAVELPFFFACLFTYARATEAKRRRGRWGLFVLAALLVALYLAPIFGPLPPDARSVALGACLFWGLPPFAGWVDRNRRISTRDAALFSPQGSAPRTPRAALRGP